jgi:hypothetical protein
VVYGQRIPLASAFEPPVLSYATTAPQIAPLQEEVVRVARVEPVWTCTQGHLGAATPPFIIGMRSELEGWYNFIRCPLKTCMVVLGSEGIVRDNL